MKIIFNKNKQKGIVLPIALFVLLCILLGAANLMRSGELSVNVTGNISNRAYVGNSNDTATLKAMQWLSQNQGNLDNDNIAEGYHSAYPVGDVDYNKEDAWEQSKVLPVDNYGNVSSYKIIRMCEQPNTPYNGSNNGVQNVCALTNKGAEGDTSSSSEGYDSTNFATMVGIRVYYQIYVKTVGARNTKIITQSVVNMTI
jgi:Tfp pilus assembly protein PilX